MYRAKQLLVLMLVVLFVIPLSGSGPVNDPPFPLPDIPDPPLDIPDFPEGPDPVDIPFDPITDLPEPWDLPPPPEAPWDDPIDEFPLPDPPDLNIDDPFPDFASLGSGEQLGYSAPPFSYGSGSAAQPADAAAANVPTKLMPFPAYIPFHPTYMGVSAARRGRVCDAALASKLIIPESRRNTVAFVDTCPWKVTKHLVTGDNPLAVAGTPDGKRALVANGGGGNVAVVDLATQTVVKTISLSPFDGFFATPNNIAVTPDGTRAYVSNHDANPGSVVYILDLASLIEVGRISVNAFPSSMAISPDGSQLWVACRGDGTLQVFDIATNEQIVSFLVPLITGIAFHPQGATLYAASGSSPGYVQVFDAVKMAPTVQIQVGNLPHAVAVTPSGHSLYVTNGLSNSISRISTISNKVFQTTKVSRGRIHPLGITFIQ